MVAILPWLLDSPLKGVEAKVSFPPQAANLNANALQQITV